MTRFIIQIVLYLAAACGGAYLYSRTVHPQVIEKLIVKEVEKPVYKYIKQVNQDDLAGLYAAYKSRIEITHYTTDKNLYISASDGYKQTSAVWQIQETPDYRVYFGIGGAGVILGGVLIYKIMK